LTCPGNEDSNDKNIYFNDDMKHLSQDLF